MRKTSTWPWLARGLLATITLAFGVTSTRAAEPELTTKSIVPVLAPPVRTIPIFRKPKSSIRAVYRGLVAQSRTISEKELNARIDHELADPNALSTLEGRERVLHMSARFDEHNKTNLRLRAATRIIDLVGAHPSISDSTRHIEADAMEHPYPVECAR